MEPPPAEDCDLDFEYLGPEEGQIKARAVANVAKDLASFWWALSDLFCHFDYQTM